MKIAIISFWTSNNNYGQLLQGYALQKYLSSLGHEAYHIRYKVKNNKSFLFYIKMIVRYVLNPKSYIKEYQRRRNDKKRNFLLFRKKYMSFSDKVYIGIKTIRRNPPKADIYITGSDQVWAQLINREDNKAFFLDFTTPDKVRVAYAVSFAMHEYPQDLKNDLNILLSKFSKIGVRELEGLKICNDININAELVPDPTLLLEKKEYNKLAKTIVKYSNYAFIYSLNINEPEDIYWSELKTSLMNKFKQIVVCNADGISKANEIFGKTVEYLYATPEEWLGTIQNSSLVITPSFHGIIFSIIFNKPFIFFPIKRKSLNGRIISILSELDLLDRICTDSGKIDSILNSSINWNEVNSKVANIRLKGFRFLEQIK